MSAFHLENFSDEELVDLANEVEVEQKSRAQRSKLDHIDAELARLRAELPTASPRHDNTPKPHIYLGGELRESQACHCRWCIQGEIGVLENRRQYMAEAK